MTNPLDEPMKSFGTARDAINVARRVLDKSQNPVLDTDLYGLTQEEGYALLDQAENQLNKLVAIVLFAAFERTLRDYLSDGLNPLSTSPTMPAELSTKLHKFLSDGVDYWRIDNVIELFNPPAGDEATGHAKGIKTFRHHVAHGAIPSNSIPPQTVYSQLTDFLKNAGLVTES